MLIRRDERQPLMLTILQVLIVFEAASLLLGSAAHLGGEIPLGVVTIDEPRIIPATIVEAICGLSLAFAGWSIFTRQRWAWTAGIGAHTIALGGVLLGVVATTLGGGPRSELNDIYHQVMIATLTAGFLLLSTTDVKVALGRDEVARNRNETGTR